jgi:Trm5-related predicted tRNA methylase
MSSPVFTTKTYAVEHLDPELGDWSKLEYINIAEETASSGSKFLLTSFSSSETVPEAFKTLSALEIHPESVEKLFTSKEDQVCLLDPSASQELSPEDGEKFSIFLFGGILGRTDVHQVLCFRADRALGDDPPRGPVYDSLIELDLTFCRQDCRVEETGLFKQTTRTSTDDY